MTDFTLISLLNVIYKFVTKIPTIRLNYVLNNLINIALVSSKKDLNLVALPLYKNLCLHGRDKKEVEVYY